MTPEETAVSGLLARYQFMESRVRITRSRRIFAETDRDIFPSMLEYIVKELKFDVLCAMTGLDEGDAFGIIYHVASQNGIVLNLKVKVPKERPVIGTVTGMFRSAEIYERELADLLGIQVEGLAEGKRYPLPDDWPGNQYPLRKDWKKEMLEGSNA
jgi:membrane-bound hydrogenase subunit beta